MKNALNYFTTECGKPDDWSNTKFITVATIACLIMITPIGWPILGCGIIYLIVKGK